MARPNDESDDIQDIDFSKLNNVDDLVQNPEALGIQDVNLPSATPQPVGNPPLVSPGTVKPLLPIGQPSGKVNPLPQKASTEPETPEEIDKELEGLKSRRAELEQAMIKARRDRQGKDFIANIGQAFSGGLATASGTKTDSGVYDALRAQNAAAETSATVDKESADQAVDDYNAEQAKLDAAEQKRQERQDALGDKNYQREKDRADRQERHQDALSGNETRQYEKLRSHVADQMENVRGTVAKQAEQDNYNATKADSLINLYGDPNKLSSAQVSLLATEIGKMASGGVPAMHELDKLDPTSLRRAVSERMSKILNRPVAANAGGFVGALKDYANALQKDAHNIITDRYQRILDTNESRLNDDDYDQFNETYINRFKGNEPETKESISSTEERKTKDGKIALFDSKTKKFVGYK